MKKNILKKMNDKNKYDGHLDEQYEDTNDIEKQILDKIKKDSEEKYKESIKLIHMTDLFMSKRSGL